jgi:L-amino acid N-acyltransferase YncA
MVAPMADDIELAAEGDVLAMLGLANASAEIHHANFATEPESLADWTASYRATERTHPWLVARAGGRVVGFAKASPHRPRGAYRWTAEVSVYVDPSAHASGVGSRLYAHLVPTLRAQGYVTLLAGISPPNPPSERLHTRFGFQRCGTYHRAGYKHGAWHDVGYWELHLSPPDLAPAPIREASRVWATVRALVAGRPVRIARADLASDEARAIIAMLDTELSAAYPEPGATHFRLDTAEVSGSRGGFFVARAPDGCADDGPPLGCGAVRMLDDTAAELKRMFVPAPWRGLRIASVMLTELEAQAARLGATRVRLETGERQASALRLYERAGYRRIPPFGEYVGSPLSVCLERELPR